MQTRLPPDSIQLLKEFYAKNNCNNSVIIKKKEFCKENKKPILDLNDIVLNSRLFFRIFKVNLKNYRIICNPEIRELNDPKTEPFYISRKESEHLINHFINWLSLVEEHNEKKKKDNLTLSTHTDLFHYELKKKFGESTTIPFNLTEIVYIELFLKNLDESVYSDTFDLSFKKLVRVHCLEIIERLPILTQSAITKNIAQVLALILINSYHSFKSVMGKLDSSIAFVLPQFNQIEEQKKLG